jgi:hypothetical protein
MLKPGSKRSQRDAAQFAIAVFDSWDALLGFLKKGRIGTPSTSDAVLYARTDDPPSSLRSGLLKAPQMRQRGPAASFRSRGLEELPYSPTEQRPPRDRGREADVPCELSRPTLPRPRGQLL